jgi:hypothetical protein
MHIERRWNYDYISRVARSKQETVMAASKPAASIVTDPTGRTASASGSPATSRLSAKAQNVATNADTDADADNNNNNNHHHHHHHHANDAARQVDGAAANVMTGRPYTSLIDLNGRLHEMREPPMLLV